MDIVAYAFLDFFKSCSWQLLMFILAGVAFELLAEFVKATLYPKDKGRGCPRWLGMALGAVVTALWAVMAHAADAVYGDSGWYMPGGLIFLPVWAILFFFYQYKAMSVAKWLRDRLFPALKDPSKTKPKKEKKAPNPTGLSQEELEAIANALKAQE